MTVSSFAATHCSTPQYISYSKMMRNRPLLSYRPKCAYSMSKIAVLICFLASNNIAGQWNHAAQAFQQPSRRTSCSSLPLQRPRYQQMISHLTSRGSDNFACIGSARKFATSNLRLHAEATSSSSSVTGIDTSKSAGSFDDFDYMAHWYPVAFARDVPYNKPTKITLFDVDYVISRSPYIPKDGEEPPKRIPGSMADDEEQVYAVLDRCPHKSASLSEGRVIPSCVGGNDAEDDGGRGSVRFQCAYHGWAFDGKTGKCADIPQVTASERSSSGGSAGSSRAETTAVPALIQQGIIFIFPGGGLEKALLYPPPPRVPELDLPGYRMVPAVRDFPIDWSILLENIMDPDHGLFAHQSKPFDLYTGSKEHPQAVNEEVTMDGKGVILRASVNAVDKLTAYDRERKLEQRDAKLAKKLKDGDESDGKEDRTKPLVATSTFYAPTHVVLARKDDEGKVASQTVFWVSPVGTGRSRFLSTFVAKLPPYFPLPRWLGHVVLNNFLDQDTHLLGTAQKYVLEAEAKALVEAEAKEEVGGDSNSKLAKDGIMARRSLYVYRSPTEKLQARLSLFFDKTLPRAPNRASTVKRLVGISKDATPSREYTLDRYDQHTKICPDSMGVIVKCTKIIKTSKILAALVAATKLLVSSLATPTDIMTKINKILTARRIIMILGALTVTSHFATKLRNAFYFNYPEEKRDRDLKKIPKLWSDAR